MKLDWITLIIECVGIAIFLIWIVVPLREFRLIRERLKRKPDSPEETTDAQGFAEDRPS